MQHVDKVADAKARFVAFIQNAVNLAQRRHHIQEQHGKDEYVAKVGLPVDGKVNRHAQNDDVKKPSSALGRSEKRHLKVVAYLFGARRSHVRARRCTSCPKVLAAHVL